MGFQRIKAVDTGRGQHPDLDDQGNLLPDVVLPLEQREFLRLRQDPARWAAFMNGVAQRQLREHPEVQEYVAGKTYDEDAYTGYANYQADLRVARSIYDHGNELTSYDVGNMSLEEYDAKFDERGRPREGFSFRPTAKDVLTDVEAGVDRYSRGELGNR